MTGKLPLTFYRNNDVLKISKALLGKYLLTKIGDEEPTGGKIVETEAYAGEIDKGSHAFGGRRTARTEVMYRPGGIAYVYLIYGFYDMFNVVSGQEGIPHATLIRAIEPEEGINTMLLRRKLTEVSPRLTAGPGVLCQALGITRELNGKSLEGDQIWIEDRGIKIPEKEIICSPRVNIAYAGEHAGFPWRFRIRDSPWTSKAK